MKYDHVNDYSTSLGTFKDNFFFVRLHRPNKAHFPVANIS